KINITLSPQNKREFIGNNPGPCMYKAGGILYSYACGASTASVNRHVPSIKNQPSYVENKHLSATGLMRGVVERQGKKFALIQALPHQDLVANEYILYEIDKNGDFKFVKHLSDLETDKNYSIYAYKDGFLLADNAL